MKKYLIVNWSKLLLWLLPPILRKKRHFKWLFSLLKPLETLYDTTLYQMQHNGQIVYLEKVLNETFNPDVAYDPNLSIEEKRYASLIYIDETLQPRLKFVYRHDEYYLHTEAEHFSLPAVINEEIVLDELGFLDPIELFTHDELACLLNPDYMVDTNGDGVINVEDDPSFCNKARELAYNTYLATEEDYTNVNYANFRIMIPASLNSGAVPSGLSEVQKAAAIQRVTNEVYFEPDPDPIKALANAVEVRTPRFHQVVNFYKLAGKTYETYKYGEETSDVLLNTLVPDQSQVSVL
ncbi:hypothetical protein [uncultured Dokdonia sp.]|uniref:hypothetical protein n=1 Tax=uncultured Dokdonia sp. TaxID=575653 RepID=UPI0026207CC2|nr:hypothetical protein [uncultured Dokdonia sp.]